MRIKNWLADLFSPTPRHRRRPRRFGDHQVVAEILEDRTLLSVGSFVELARLTASDAAEEDFFGTRAAISADGQTIVVGSDFNDGGGIDSGAAYVYHRDGNSFAETKLIAGDAAAGDRFGVSLAISADGGTIVVGSPRDDDASNDSGSVYIYDWDGNSFVETKLTAGDAGAGDNFGVSVAVSADGDTVVVGSWFDADAGNRSGSAYVYRRNGSGFTETKIAASDAAAGDLFGGYVATSANGQTLVVGSRADDDAGNGSGSAYVYRWDGDAFAETKLTAGDAAAVDLFGYPVAISADGETVVVGSFNDDDAGTDSGSAYVYDWNGSGFIETKLTASDGAAGDRFGISLAVSDDGETVIVGSFLDDDAGSSSGSAYVYERNGGSFTETKLTASDPAAYNTFGSSVAVAGDGDTIVVGLGSHNSATNNQGAAYVFVSDDTPANEPPTANAGGPYFGVEGTSFSLDGAGSSDPEDAMTDLLFEWDLDFDGTTFDIDETGIQPAVSFADDFATRTIALRVTDTEGESHVAVSELTIINADPTVAGPVVINSHEDAIGFSVNLLTGASDAGVNDVLSVDSLTLAAGDDTGVTIDGDTLNIDPAAYNHLAAGESEVIAYGYDIIDGDGGTVAQTATITIEGRNDGPAIVEVLATAADPGTVAQGETVDLTATFVDVDLNDSHNAVIDWGDGSTSSGLITPATGGGGISASHVYAAGGTYTITVTLLDASSAPDSAALPVFITGVGVQEGVLQIVGSEGDDQVHVTGFFGVILVTGNGAFSAPTVISQSEVESLHVLLGEGNDIFRSLSSLPGTIDGGDGNDLIYGGFGDNIVRGGAGDDALFGGLGNDVLIGGGGDDLLIGGFGRNVLIGGAGSDTLLGFPEQNILIGGSTVYDADDTALNAIRDEWSSTNSAADRMANLTNGGGANGNVVLQPGLTLLDDEEDDLVFAGFNDWMIDL